MGKFCCPKCKIPRSIIPEYNIYHINGDFSLFRSRVKNDIKKWIFKYDDFWIGNYNNQYSSIKDCWEETGGFSEEELAILSKNKWKCINCDYVSNTFKTFIYQKQSVNAEEDNKLKLLEKELQEEKNKTKLLEKEIQEEKNKNIILNEKINVIMNELKEIKGAVFEIQKKS